MSSASRIGLIVALAAVIAAPVAWLAHKHDEPRPVTHLVVPAETVRLIDPDPQQLRVCADPNNVPFSNARGEGFENAIAAVVAHDLGKTLSYFWLPQRRGFVRNSLNAGVCDVIMGVPAGYDLVRTTRAYYRSSYVFVSPAGQRPIRTFDDPALRTLTVGIPITGDDYENPPPAMALAARHLMANVRGYPVYGDYSQPAPQRVVIDDVGAGRIDVAVVWGPIGGYFARRSRTPLRVTPVSPQRDADAGPFTFAIAMGVRRSDTELAQALDQVLQRRRTEIASILRQFGVPLVETGAGS